LFAADIIQKGAMRVVTPPNEHRLVGPLAWRGHDLAPLDHDMARVLNLKRYKKVLAKNLMCIDNRIMAASKIDRVGRCGTLTHRQDAQAKRKHLDGIAAAQHNNGRDGVACRGSNRNEPFGRTLWTGGHLRRVAALSHGVLGFRGAIGLIRVVRSASSRG
jgi:hypothetical protein